MSYRCSYSDILYVLWVPRTVVLQGEKPFHNTENKTAGTGT